MISAERSSLIVAVCHPDGRTAGEAWQQLCAQHDGPDGVVDWMNSGGEQRLLPLLGTRSRVLSLSPSVVRSCEDATARAWGINVRLLNQITPVVRAWKTTGVHAVALKGLSLLGDVYRDHQLRPIGDADILIHRAELRPALEVMAEHGWTVARRTTLHFKGGGTAVNFSHASGDSIDIHLRPSRNIPLRPRNELAVWGSIEPLPVAHPLSGLGLVRPNSIQQAVTLIAHASRPQHANLLHVHVDLHRLFVRRTELQSAAAGEQLIEALRYEWLAIRGAKVLGELHTLLGTPLPIEPGAITPTDDAAAFIEQAAIDADERIAAHARRRRIRDLATVGTAGQSNKVRAKVYAGLLLRKTVARLD